MGTYRYFLKHVLFAGIAMLMACAGLHLAADPYDVFGTPKIEGLNQVKAVIGSKQRIFEAVELLRRKPQAVIFGTSRSDIGIDPNHAAFSGLTRFNAAASGQHIGETEELLRTLLDNSPDAPQIVVIGLDFMAFNALAPDPFDYSPDNLSALRRFQLLFSISTTLDSMRTLQRQNYYYQLGLGGLLRNDGFREYIGNPAMKRHEQFEGSEEGFLRNTYNAPPSCTWSAQDTNRRRDYLESFRSILHLAHTRKVDLKLFISPSHARQWETVAAAGLWPKFEQWKRDLVRINQEEAQSTQSNPFSLIDFSGYNSITTEAVSDEPEMLHYWESSHYRKTTGDLVLNRLFNIGKTPADFGHAINTQNIEGWLVKTKKAQNQYRATHPADVDIIKRLAAKVANTSPCAARNVDHQASRR